MMKKVWLVLLAVVLVFGLAVLGCSNNNDSGGGGGGGGDGGDGEGEKTERKVPLGEPGFMWSGGVPDNQKGWYTEGYANPADPECTGSSFKLEDFLAAKYLVLKMKEKKDSGYTLIWGGDQGINDWQGWIDQPTPSKAISWNADTKELKIQLSLALKNYESNYLKNAIGVRLVIQNNSFTLTDFIESAYLLIYEGDEGGDGGEDGGGDGEEIGTPEQQAAFNAAVGIKELTQASSGNNIVIDTDTGIISREKSTGYGSWVSVAIPAASLTPAIIASDTIVVKYIGLGGNIPIVLKQSNTTTDISSSGQYQTLTGDGTVRTLEIPAVRYGEAIPTAVWTFQGNNGATEDWKLKVIDITVVNGAPIKITLPVADLKPVSGGTPKATITGTLQFTGGTIVWTPAATTFAAGTGYSAAFTLTAKAGYTFDGIAANSFVVTGATTVTHVVGTTTLSVTAAVFPDTASPAPEKPVTFTNANEITGVSATTALITGGYSVDQTAQYGNGFAYFRVKFADGYKLSDYSKFDCTVKLGGTDGGWKNPRLFAYATAPSSLTDGGVNKIATDSDNNTGSAGTPKSYTLTLNPIDASIDLNEVIIVIHFWSKEATYEITNIKFYN